MVACMSSPRLCMWITSRRHLKILGPIRCGSYTRSGMDSSAEATCCKPFNPSFLQTIAISPEAFAIYEYGLATLRLMPRAWEEKTARKVRIYIDNQVS